MAALLESLIGLEGSCTQLAVWARRYANVQMSSRITVRRDGKSKMADCKRGEGEAGRG